MHPAQVQSLVVVVAVVTVVQWGVVGWQVELGHYSLVYRSVAHRKSGTAASAFLQWLAGPSGKKTCSSEGSRVVGPLRTLVKSSARVESYLWQPNIMCCSVSISLQ